MELRDGRYYCSRCGTPLGLGAEDKPTVMILAKSGEKNVRLVVLDGKEIHRCALEPGTAA